MPAYNNCKNKFTHVDTNRLCRECWGETIDQNDTIHSLSDMSEITEIV